MRIRRAATGGAPAGPSTLTRASRETLREYVGLHPGFPGSIPPSIPLLIGVSGFLFTAGAKAALCKIRTTRRFADAPGGKRVGFISSAAAIQFASAFRRAAQYFFIRSDTALRAAADMVLRRRGRRLGPPAAAVVSADSAGAARLDVRRRRPPNRSGNARRIAASSRRSSSRRDFAPILASSCNSCRVKSATSPP